MKLIELLPDDYRKSPPTVMVQEAMGTATSRLENDLAEMEEQLFLDTATWGLGYWEDVFGIKSERGRDLALRRSAVRAKLRGAGTTTVEMIQNVSESFVNGQVEVIEHSAEYRFDIVMKSVIGIPPNMEDLRQAIEEIKPAHLAYDIIIKYNTWGMVEDARYRWVTAERRTWAELKEVAL